MSDGGGGFDWSAVHDFDDSEAGRQPDDVERLVAAYNPDSDVPDVPPWIDGQ